MTARSTTVITPPRHVAFVASILGVVLVATLIAFAPLLKRDGVAAGDSANATAAEPTAVTALRGIHYDPPRPAPEIGGIDQNGKPFLLSRQPHPLQLVIFGYVSCIDVCPTNLKKMELIQKRMGADSDQIQFVFVSVAPEHEDPPVLREYLDQYDGEIIGLTSKEPTGLDEVYQNWGIVRRKTKLGTPILGRDYKYDHTAQMYLVRDGEEVVVSYPYGTGVDLMVEDLTALLADPALAHRLPEIGEVQTVALPPGTFTRAAQENPTIPAYLRIRKGTAIRWKNDDYMYHFIGDISLAPGAEALQRFDETGTFYYGCTAVPSEVIRIAVFDEVEG